MAKLYLFNTLTHHKGEFLPLRPGQAGMYTCGPTVYWYAHIGNLKAYLFEDILRRVLAYNGFSVKHIMNITDVGHLTGDTDDTGEDKMERAAGQEGKSVWDIAEFYTKAFKKDLTALNILPPSKWVKATDHIKEQIALISRLEDGGFTYRTSDGIYFDTSRFPGYGVLAPKNVGGIKEGARVAFNEEKRNAADFALWKFSPGGAGVRGAAGASGAGSAAKKRQMEWKSPWGVGFPGWHIECSAMAMKYLGETFDIHCGGIDHIMIHHTNEIAQSEAVTGKPFARYWLHGNFLGFGGVLKMAKSSGSILRLPELVEAGFAPLAYRYLNLTAHYRTPLQFSDENMKAAAVALDHLYSAFAELGSKKGRGCPSAETAFLEAVNDDLNTPRALAVVWDLIKSSEFSDGDKRASLLKFDEVLGLGLASFKKAKLVVPAAVKKLVLEREKARRAKDFKRSDEIRDELATLGFTVEDAKDGAVVKKI